MPSDDTFEAEDLVASWRTTASGQQKEDKKDSTDPSIKFGDDNTQLSSSEDQPTLITTGLDEIVASEPQMSAPVSGIIFDYPSLYQIVNGDIQVHQETPSFMIGDMDVAKEIKQLKKRVEELEKELGYRKSEKEIKKSDRFKAILDEDQ